MTRQQQHQGTYHLGRREAVAEQEAWHRQVRMRWGSSRLSSIVEGIRGQGVCAFGRRVGVALQRQPQRLLLRDVLWLPWHHGTAALGEVHACTAQDSMHHGSAAAERRGAACRCTGHTYRRYELLLLSSHLFFIRRLRCCRRQARAPALAFTRCSPRRST